MRPGGTLDLSLYLVLDPDLCGGAANMLRTARLAAENGATVVQLRAPRWKKRQWLESALELKRILGPLGVALIINDHVDIALASDADGVHIGQADLPAAVARRLLGPDRWLGLSVSNTGELVGAAGVADGLVDYLGIGPVYPTATKSDAAPATGLATLAELVAAGGLPAVAIGGIDLDNCLLPLQAGASGVAVVSAICGQDDPARCTEALRGKIGAYFALRRTTDSAQSGPAILLGDA